MCHQTVCLIARHFEAKGLPTLILGSGLDIMESGRPPRAAFLDYPLGFEAGRFKDRENQLTVVREALAGFDTLTEPGIVHLDHEWPAGWVMMNERDRSKSDHRSLRDETPQYQTEADRLAAERSA